MEGFKDNSPLGVVSRSSAPLIMPLLTELTIDITIWQDFLEDNDRFPTKVLQYLVKSSPMLRRLILKVVGKGKKTRFCKARQ